MSEFIPVGDSGNEVANKAVIERLWECLGRRDFDGVGALFSANGVYNDVPMIGGDPGAIGPVEVTARLRLGLGPLEKYVLNPGPMLPKVTSSSPNIPRIGTGLLASITSCVSAVCMRCAPARWSAGGTTSISGN